MFFALNYDSLVQNAAIHHSMFVDRAQQFVVRHKWPLRLDGSGLEVDEYDDPLATYCVVTDGIRHLASVRLRPAATDSMVEQHFPELWHGMEALREGVEITRFCAAPSLSPDARLTVVSDLLLGLCRHCQRAGIGSVFGVVFPAVARVLKQAGWPGEVLNATQDADATLLLARWVPDDLVAWSIQECRELREETWRRRRHAIEASREQLMVA